MMVTLNMSPSSAAIVRLIPSMAIDPLNTINGSNSAGTRTRSHQLSSPRASSDTNSPVPSTWPCTMWPLSRPVGASGRSRLTRAPARSAPKLLRRRVSGATSAENESGRTSTAVRQTPLTAMLTPSLASESTVAQRTPRRAPAARLSIAATVPSSSIIPVNIEVTLHGELVGRNGMHRHAPHLDRVRATTPTDSAGQRQGLQPAQNLGSVIEEYAVHDARLQRCPVHFAAGFDHQGKVPLAPQPVDRGAQIGASARTVHHQHLHAARLQHFSAFCV